MSVVLTGAGSLSSLGVGCAAGFAALCAGRGGGPTVPDFDPLSFLGGKGLRHWDRTALLLGCSARMALADAGLVLPSAVYGPADWGVVVGSTHGSIQAIAEFDQEAVREGPQYVNPAAFANTTINQPAGRVSMLFDLPGLNTTISTGLASALDAFDYAAMMLEQRRIRALLCGSALGSSAEIQEGYARAGRLAPHGSASIPFAAGRRGPRLAEGGAMFVVERTEDAAARGARPLARLAGHGSAFSTSSSGVHDAVAAALQAAGLAVSELSCVYAFASGCPEGDRAEALALLELGITAPITAPKAATGDCLEASGALAVALALESLRSGRVPPIAGLERVDPVCAGLDLVRGDARGADVRHVLVCARDWEGPCSAMILSQPA